MASRSLLKTANLPSADRAVVRRVAPAKLNLFLHVVGRRPDGYHELESLFAFTKKGDEIELRSSETLSLKITGPFADALVEAGGGDENNLVLRAALALQNYAGTSRGVHVHLIKNLPIASGIGGGSADAAACLNALNEFWGLQVPSSELEKVALSLGADVPACLYNSPLYVSGIGEHIEATSLPTNYGILLVNPGAPVSTPAVFKKFHTNAHNFSGQLGSLAPNEEKTFLHWLAGCTSNDLEAPAKSVCASISDVLLVLKTECDADLVRMSGSGATCFAIFDQPEKARSAKERLERQYPHWWFWADELQAG